MLISKCGNLEVTFNYDRKGARMMITVHAAKDIPTKERGGSNNNQVSYQRTKAGLLCNIDDIALSGTVLF